MPYIGKGTQYHKSDDFINVFHENFLKQLVRESTGEDSILDLVLTYRDNLDSNMEIGVKLGTSDHQEILFKIKWDMKLSLNHVQVPDFRKANYEGLRKHLSGWRMRLQMARRGQVRLQVFTLPHGR